jgi:uncharacterized protein YbjQ (UPF0145 family)
MKKVILMAVLAGCALSAQASDNKLMLPIDNAFNANDAKTRLGDDVKFYFAGQPTPKVIEKRGSDKTSQKTNSFNKSAEKACNWAFLSAMLQLEKRAREMGANAVINIVSNYKNVENASATEFECHEGALMAGVAFKADFARVDSGK